MIAIIGVVVGVAGLGFAAFMYFHPRKRHRFVYQTMSVRYFDQARLTLPKEAAMTFESGLVERLSMTTIVMWNAGSEVLRGDDIVKADPIRVSISDGRVLSNRVVKTTTQATDVCSIDRSTESELGIRYRYLNPGDGAVIEIVHDGSSSSVTGTAMGLKDGPEHWGDIPMSSPLIREWVIGGVVPAMTGLFLIVGTWMAVSMKNHGVVLHEDFFLPTGIMAVAAAITITRETRSRWGKRRRYPSSLTPPPK